MSDNHSEIIVRFAEGRATSLSKCENKAIAWGKLRERLSNPRRDRESLKQFLKLPLVEQGRLKGADGWFLGGAVEGGKRVSRNIASRDLICFDVDDCSPDIFFLIQQGVAPICRYEFQLHTTRKHTPEKPRFRMVLPVESPVQRAVYEPVTRILGTLIDPTLDGIDDVTFRVSQLMYWPTISRDSQWVAFHNPGELVEPETVLEGFERDWRDFKNLPFSEKRSRARRKADKAENPLEKRGVIGAFCRAFDIHAAIAEHIPEVYVPGDESSGNPRYTFSEGSVANGAVVYDDGLFLYSNHDTDPCGHQNVNAFDLVRIHKFGKMDEGVDLENTSVTDLPSFKAMVEFAKSLTPVTAELVQDKYDLAAMFDDLPPEEKGAIEDDPTDDLNDLLAELIGDAPDSGLPPRLVRRKPKKPPENWRETRLDLGAEGVIKQTLHNSTTIIANDPRLFGVIGLNAFSNKITARRSLRTKLPTVPPILVEDKVNGLPWKDVHDFSIRAILEAPRGDGKAGWGYKISDRDVRQAIRLTAENWIFHPVQEYYEDALDGWDNVRGRVETLFIRYLGTPDTPYYREAAKLALVANVARVYFPGHKWDHVPILTGAQGIRKSTFLKVLARHKKYHWFGELTAEMASGKDTVEQMLGKLIMELPELAHMRRGDVNTVKQFITLESDEVRLSYGARMSDFKRGGTFWGTTNETEYLKDGTGNRRFWPIACKVDRIDTDALEAEIDHIWAEAVIIYREMCREHGYKELPLYLTGEALEEATLLQDMAREEDSIQASAAQIAEYLSQPIRLSKLRRSWGDIAADFHEDDDPLVLRVKTCPREAYCETFNINPGELSKSRTLETAAGQMMGRVEGWRKTGKRIRVPAWGQVREYVREGASREELEQGYKHWEPQSDGPFPT